MKRENKINENKEVKLSKRRKHEKMREKKET